MPERALDTLGPWPILQGLGRMIFSPFLNGQGKVRARAAALDTPIPMLTPRYRQLTQTTSNNKILSFLSNQPTYIFRSGLSKDKDTNMSNAPQNECFGKSVIYSDVLKLQPNPKKRFYEVPAVSSSHSLLSSIIQRVVK